MSDEKVGGNAKLTLINRSKNIMVLDDFSDTDGRPIILGTDMDRGVIGAPQPEATVTLATVRKMKEHPAFSAMLEEFPPQLEVRRPFSI